jgi:hypothetical protein
MIEYKSNKVLLSFEDWTPEMMILSSKLHMLPDPPGERAPRNHEVGIDHLNSFPRGSEAIEALFDLVDDLKYRPDGTDVFRMGMYVIKANVELDALLANRRRDGVGLQERRRKRLSKISPTRTTGKIGFTREN